jgi:thiazole synthase ThiGH ThiG subunit
VDAGRDAFLAGRMAKKPYEASPSSPEGGLIQKSA